MSRTNQVSFEEGTTEDYTDFSAGVRWNIKKNDYEMTHHDQDAWLIRLVHNRDEEGYISIMRAPATSGTPSFTELFRFNFDGNLYIRAGDVEIT